MTFTLLAPNLVETIHDDVQFSGKGMKALHRMLRGEMVMREDVGMRAGERREFEDHFCHLRPRAEPDI